MLQSPKEAMISELEGQIREVERMLEEKDNEIAILLGQKQAFGLVLIRIQNKMIPGLT
jgi:DNA-binding FrmR family transcriptional regulator